MTTDPPIWTPASLEEIEEEAKDDLLPHAERCFSLHPHLPALEPPTEARRGPLAGSELVGRLTEVAERYFRLWLVLEGTPPDRDVAPETWNVNLGIVGSCFLELQMRAMVLTPIVGDPDWLLSWAPLDGLDRTIIERILGGTLPPMLASLERIVATYGRVWAEADETRRAVLGRWYRPELLVASATQLPLGLSVIRREFRNQLTHLTKHSLPSAAYGLFVRRVFGTRAARTWLDRGPDARRSGAPVLHDMLMGWSPESRPVEPRIHKRRPRVEQAAGPAGQSVRDLVERFDADFDMPHLQHVCLGQLQTLGAFRPVDAGARSDVLAEHVGAAWCRIVTADVDYDIEQGLRLVQATRELAEQLESRLPATPASDDELWYTHVVARWYDGAAKVFYRAAKFTHGRLYFKKAVALAERGELWWCRWDLTSNLTRSELEEHRLMETTPPPEVRAAQYASLIEQATRECESLGIVIGQRPEGHREREVLRGLCSLLHNAADEMAKPDPARSAAWGAESLALARTNGDQYRAAQSTLMKARRSIAQIEKAQQGEELLLLLEEAEQALHEVLELPWERGRQIARQQLVVTTGRRDTLLALRKADELVARLFPKSSTDWETAGFDLDYKRHTLNVFAKALEEATASGLLSESAARPYRTRLRDCRLASAREVRKVVVVSKYKQGYSNHIEPVYREAISHKLFDGHAPEHLITDTSAEYLEDAFGFVEESSGRELLDVIANSLGNSGPTEILTATPIPVELEPLPAAVRGAQPRRSGLRSPARRSGDFAAALQQRQAAHDSRLLDQPITTAAHDSEIGRRLRMYTTNYPGVAIVRYFRYSTGSGVALGAYVFRRDRMTVHCNLAIEPVLKAWITFRDHSDATSPEPEGPAPGPTAVRGRRGEPTSATGREGPAVGDNPVDPFVTLAELMTTHLIEPVWNDVCTPDYPTRLVLIPCDEVFQLPLHVAFEPGSKWPLAASLPLCFSVSATAHVSRARHLLGTQFIEPDDDLCVLAQLDDRVSGRELKDLDWPEKQLHWAGPRPTWLPRRFSQHRPEASRENLPWLLEPRPELFVYCGHGVYEASLSDLGPALVLEGDVITQYDIATLVRLPRNKLTLLGACVTGQGVDLGGGEVSGFLRSFMAAGCGALAVTLWPVLDEAIVDVAGSLLRAIKTGMNGPVDLVQKLFQASLARCKKVDGARERLEACPVVLYL